MSPSESMKNFAERLKALRLGQKKLTVAEAAKELGVASTNLNNWERGVAKPPFDMLPKFAEYYNVTVDYLVGYAPSEKTQHILDVLNGLTEKEQDGVINLLDVMKKKEQ
ncbi:helix-turn-helix domain-containing protein [Anaerovibrio lipolyticus]|uniref:helix-turn-helix domain-containing protein n=1 Tax=Anaerovibrio lipolyticus TaxID=82374 RepID=UPI0009DEA235|nr:helix-turn-helix transcriptional regulator [Anaerovibrio lipolyticus]